MSLQTEGAGNAGCALHPRSRVQDCTKKAHTSIQVQRRQSGIPCAMALRLMPCSPRRRIRLVTVAAGLMADQDPVGSNLPPTAWHQQRVSGPHGFAVRNQRRSSCALLNRSRGRSSPCDHLARRRCRVHRIPSRVRDDGQRPSCGDEMARAGRTDLPDETGQERLFSWLERSRAG